MTTTERTRGMLRTEDKSFAGFGLHTIVGPDNTLSASENAADAQHLAACWNAIEAIGGDPATVGEMAEALDEITTWLEAVIHNLGSTTNQHESWAPTSAARALLARIGGE